MPAGMGGIPPDNRNVIGSQHARLLGQTQAQIMYMEKQWENIRSTPNGRASGSIGRSIFRDSKCLKCQYKGGLWCISRVLNAVMDNAYWVSNGLQSLTSIREHLLQDRPTAVHRTVVCEDEG